LAAHKRTAAEVEASLRLREEAAAKCDRITLAGKASADRRAEELRLREEACREWDATLAEREAEVNRREVALRRLGEQLAKREEAVAGRVARHLESARAERAAIAAKASELEAREKDLAAGGPLGGVGLASQLAMAQNTLADLERLVQDQAGEIAALRLTNEIGPGQLSDAVDRLERAGRRVGISVRRDSKLPPTQPALMLRLDELAADLERLEEEVGETIKLSSASLARAAVELVLASHQAREPDFVPWRALEDFPPGTEARAREQVREAADAIVSNFDGSAPRFAFGLASDEESRSGGDNDDVGDEDWDDVVSGAGLGGPDTP
jgi:DNA repair exonuclease SbcCD ATPase subunit